MGRENTVKAFSASWVEDIYSLNLKVRSGYAFSWNSRPI
jgi:hypothetical protein